MSNHDNKNVQFDIAEVTEINNSFKWNNSIASSATMFMCRAVSCTTYTDTYTYDIVPMSKREIKIPVVGEIILICRTVNRSFQQKKDKGESWYYMQTVDLQDGVNNNRSTGMTSTAQENVDNDPQYRPAGTNFEDLKISPLQPFEGDIIYQGRWGNSIRFGSTISTIPDDNYYHKSPTWNGDTNGSPITILSNGRINLDKKEFVVEDINIDNSSIYLTSTQRIPIVLGSDNKPNSLTGCITLGGNESQYIGSQLLGVSDRVILKARKDLVVIDSPLGIVLNSTGEIKLGSEDATESIVHGDVLLDILSLIINQFNTVIDPNTYDYINKSNSIKAQKKLQELLSSKYFINKNTY